MKIFLQHFSEKIRASAWTVPASFAVLAIVAANLSLWADGMFRDANLGWLDWIKPASAEGAETLLSTIAASMLAIAGVSFSSIMVTMTLASQQFGPRLLRNFIKDKLNQVVLGALIGTFIFCIFILRGIETVDGAISVPQLSTVLALSLALICLGLFIRFVHHILNQIQAEEVCADAYQVFEESIDTIFPSDDEDSTEHRVTDNELEGWKIIAGKTGYVQAVNITGLVALAQKYDAVFMTNRRAGHFISKGQAVVTVATGPDLKDVEEDLIAEVQKSFFVGSVRTPEQDYEYGIRQLVEVALRALSPGVNDPFTAMNCVDYLGAGIQEAFSRSLPGSIHRDEEGEIRVFSWPSSYRSIVESAVNQIRQAAYDKCDVSCHLLEMLTEVALVAEKKEQQEALYLQARLINQDTLSTLHNEHDCEAIRSRFVNFLTSCHLIEPFESD
ncbi:DUF2254 domain-containing protein [bacterium]|nr:DUF2254 domain-containing protein [bacterium]